jgi:hypothetical protein
MHTYYLYELGENGQIFARHEIEAEDDDDAVGAAWGFPASGVKCQGFEVWIGCRLVFQSSTTLMSELCQDPS